MLPERLEEGATEEPGLDGELGPRDEEVPRGGVAPSEEEGPPVGYREGVDTVEAYIPDEVASAEDEDPAEEDCPADDTAEVGMASVLVFESTPELLGGPLYAPDEEPVGTEV
jgi:hypothetical protein